MIPRAFKQVVAWVATAVIAVTVSGCTVPDSFSEQDLHRPFQQGPVPAPASHRDAYAGFEVDIPSGWIVARNTLGLRYAPSRDALFEHGTFDKSWARPQMFTVFVGGHQNTTAREYAREQYRRREGDPSSRRTRFQLAGRPAERIRGYRSCTRTPLAGDNSNCFDDLVVVQWDEETTVTMSLLTHRKDLASRVQTFESMFGSLRERDLWTLLCAFAKVVTEVVTLEGVWQRSASRS